MDEARRSRLKAILHEHGRAIKGPRLVVGVGFALIAIVLVIVLSGAPPAATRPPVALVHTTLFGRTNARSRICQAGETLPRATTAIRVWLEAVVGPPVQLQALAGGRVIAHGARGAGWTAGSVTVPISPVPRATARVTVCVNMAQAREPVGLQGLRTSRLVAASDRQGPNPHAKGTHGPTYQDFPLPGRLLIEYLRPGSRSWWSLARSVLRRMGLGHAGSGAWIPLLAVALMLVVAALSSRLIWRELT
jgi:hypothetical protein